MGLQMRHHLRRRQRVEPFGYFILAAIGNRVGRRGEFCQHAAPTRRGRVGIFANEAFHVRAVRIAIVGRGGVILAPEFLVVERAALHTKIIL